MQGRGREDTAYPRPCLPRNMTPRQREREEGSRRDFTGVAIAPRGWEHLPPPPPPVRVTRLPLVLPKPLRHPAGLAVGRSARSSTCPFVILWMGRRPPSREPGLRASLGRGTNRTRAAVGASRDVTSAALAPAKQVTGTRKTCPAARDWEFLNLAGFTPRASHAPRRLPQPVSARPAIFQTLFWPPIRIE